MRRRVHRGTQDSGKANVDFERARRRMVERLRSSGLSEPPVVTAFLKVPRDRFVHQEAMSLRAYDDVALPIGLGQTLSAPSTQAKMTSALQIDREHRVLEVGTGSGYQTAILAELAGKVFTIERHEALSRRAVSLLRELGYRTILATVGDGSLGWPERAPFDRILLTCCAPGLMGPLAEQLQLGGLLVGPRAEHGGRQRLIRLRKDAQGSLHEEDLGPCQFVPLVGEAGYDSQASAPTAAASAPTASPARTGLGGPVWELMRQSRVLKLVEGGC